MTTRAISGIKAKGAHMAVTFNTSFSIEGKKIRYILLIIQSLIFVLPIGIFLYIYYANRLSFELYQYVLIALTLVLILAGMVILRRLFDSFLMVATLIKNFENGGRVEADIQGNTAELHEIVGSFNSLLSRFERTNAEIKHKTFELFVIKELIEVAGKVVDMNDLLGLFLEKAMAVSGAQIGSVCEIEFEKQRFRVVVSRGPDAPPPRGRVYQF